ncbi:MAG: NrsF family protein [Myxococcota bacterium]|nr:NrsF family protein [Myxococcota bacterium]
MSEGPTDELIRELARDLEPVRPIPPVRRVALGVLALWGLVATAGVALRGFRPDFGERLLMEMGAGGVFAGLATAGVCGVVAALAAAVPGRERLARGALLAGAAGLGVAAGIGSFLVVQSPVGDAAPPAADLVCLGVALAVGFLPALATVWFAGRALAQRPLAVVLAAAAGTAALGGVTAQASCPHADPAHLMLGHVLAPVAGAVVLTLPLLWALGRLRR